MRENEILEGRLAELEADPAFQSSMKRALQQIANGKVIPHDEVERKLRGRIKED